ncbi:unnamed protein product [Calypogeia fissa]
MQFPPPASPDCPGAFSMNGPISRGPSHVIISRDCCLLLKTCRCGVVIDGSLSRQHSAAQHFYRVDDQGREAIKEGDH